MRTCLILIVLFLFDYRITNAQNLFPEKFDDCNVGRFCLDCGDEQGKFKEDLNTYFNNKFTEKQLRGIKGFVFVQVIIDSAGNHCVQSIGNQATGNVSKLRLRDVVNSMSGWQPAITAGKPESVSITLQYTFDQRLLDVSYHRFDLSSVTNMSSVGDVEITNKDQKYSKNTNFNLRVFTTENSILPWDMTRAVSIDSNNVVWLGTDNGIVKIKDDKMEVFNSENSPLKTRFGQTTIMAAAVDSRNSKWFSDGYTVYKYDDSHWVIYDSTNSPINWTTGIYADPSGNTWFVTSVGVVKYDGQKWSVIDTSNSKLPSNWVTGIFVDSKKRVWIGTHDGNLMLDKTSAEDFKETETPLKDAFIAAGSEDKAGNLWFALYEQGRNRGGLAKLSADGKWALYNTSNSGIPCNDVLDVAADDKSNSIWLSMNKVGLTKFDGTNWIILTPENSKVPSTYIQEIVMDNNGNLWCATFGGLLEVLQK